MHDDGLIKSLSSLSIRNANCEPCHGPLSFNLFRTDKTTRKRFPGAVAGQIRAQNMRSMYIFITYRAMIASIAIYIALPPQQRLPGALLHKLFPLNDTERLLRKLARFDLHDGRVEDHPW